MADPGRQKYFLARIDRKSGCWLWRLHLSPDGYGRALGKQAHRLAYEAWRGRIPEGLVIDHLCRVRHCVNPDHLEPVEKAVNDGRGFSIAVINSRKNECLRGHEFTDENTYRRPDRNSRECRICNANAAGRYRRRLTVKEPQP